MSTRAVILAGTVRVRRGSTRVRGGGGTETAGASQLAIFSISSKSSVSSLSIFLSEGRERRLQREPRADRSGRRQGRGSLGRARPPPPAAGLPAPPRWRPGRALRVHGDHPVLGKARAGTGPGPSRDSLKCSWILFRMFMLCLLSTMFTARPRLPKRPVRPIRCR